MSASILHKYSIIIESMEEGSAFINDTVDAGNTDYILSPIEDKIVKAIVLSVVLLVGVVTNVLIVVYTVCHPKSLKQSSIVLLLGSSVVNLIILLSQAPVQIITISFEEFIFGSTTKERDLSCAIIAYFTTVSSVAAYYMLALISVDRFLLLVKPLIHKQYFKPWLLLVVIGLIVASMPLVQVTTGDPEFGRHIYLCMPPYRYITPAVPIINMVVILTPVVTIAVTTVWTFVSTRRFIKSDHQRRVDAIGNREEVSKEVEDNLYTKRIKNLFGIFSLLLIIQAISILPVVTIIIVGLAIDVTEAPPYVSTIFFICNLLHYTGSVSNPLIQCYFRQDLSNAFKAAYAKVMHRCSSSSSPEA